MAASTPDKGEDQTIEGLRSLVDELRQGFDDDVLKWLQYEVRKWSRPSQEQLCSLILELPEAETIISAIGLELPKEKAENGVAETSSSPAEIVAAVPPKTQAEAPQGDDVEKKLPEAEARVTELQRLLQEHREKLEAAEKRVQAAEKQEASSAARIAELEAKVGSQRYPPRPETADLQAQIVALETQLKRERLEAEGRIKRTLQMVDNQAIKMLEARAETKELQVRELEERLSLIIQKATSWDGQSQSITPALPLAAFDCESDNGKGVGLKAITSDAEAARGPICHNVDRCQNEAHSKGLNPSESELLAEVASLEAELDRQRERARLLEKQRAEDQIRFRDLEKELHQTKRQSRDVESDIKILSERLEPQGRGSLLKTESQTGAQAKCIAELEAKLRMQQTMADAAAAAQLRTNAVAEEAAAAARAEIADLRAQLRHKQQGLEMMEAVTCDPAAGLPRGTPAGRPASAITMLRRRDPLTAGHGMAALKWPAPAQQSELSARPSSASPAGGRSQVMRVGSTANSPLLSMLKNDRRPRSRHSARRANAQREVHGHTAHVAVHGAFLPVADPDIEVP